MFVDPTALPGLTTILNKISWPKIVFSLKMSHRCYLLRIFDDTSPLAKLAYVPARPRTARVSASSLGFVCPNAGI